MKLTKHRYRRYKRCDQRQSDWYGGHVSSGHEEILGGFVLLDAIVGPDDKRHDYCQYEHYVVNDAEVRWTYYRHNIFFHFCHSGVSLYRRTESISSKCSYIYTEY